jgi:hypothetical protein
LTWIKGCKSKVKKRLSLLGNKTLCRILLAELIEIIKNEGETSLTNTEKEFLDEYAKRRVK